MAEEKLRPERASGRTSGASAKRPRKSKKPSFTVGFRLDGDELMKLESKAAEYDISLHAFARRLVLEALREMERERVLDEVSQVREELHQEMETLRDDLATVISTILLNTTPESEETVKAWVSDNLRH
jgi:hypothetical protein